MTFSFDQISPRCGISRLLPRHRWSEDRQWSPASAIRTDVRASMRSSQESHINEGLEQRVACDAVKAPQPLYLVPG
jgi:hypothetical protein